MAHRYGHLIAVTLNADGSPASLRWQGREYRVQAIYARWLLRERRWGAIQGAALSEVAAAGEEHYFRLACEGDFLCEVYYAAAEDRWILDRVLD